MPILPSQSLELEPDALRVLITGFGVRQILHRRSVRTHLDRSFSQPFSVYKDVNPSWLAVRPLHNTILYTQSPAVPVTHHDQTVEAPPKSSRQIHVTTLEVPVKYDAVLSQIPGVHKSPPVLPMPEDPAFAVPPPPEKGYDFIMHVGVAGIGSLYLEKLAHKWGYRKPDVDGKYAPEGDFKIESGGQASQAETFERLRLGLQEMIWGPNQPRRGFTAGYESFADELRTQLDVDELLFYLQEAGIEVRIIVFRCDAMKLCTDALLACTHIYRPGTLSLRIYLLLFARRGSAASSGTR